MYRVCTVCAVCVCVHCTPRVRRIDRTGPRRRLPVFASSHEVCVCVCVSVCVCVCVSVCERLGGPTGTCRRAGPRVCVCGVWVMIIETDQDSRFF